MSGIATAIVGGAVIGAVASSNAADTQADAARDASDLTHSEYLQNRADMAPWRDAGTMTLGQLTKGLSPGGEFDKNFTLGDFQKDPGYQFRMGEGSRAVENSAAARGGLLSGRTLKELSRYGQGFASNEYTNAYNRFNTDQSNRFNRLSSVAGLGQTAAGTIAQLGSNDAQIQSNNIIAGGNARASGYVGTANAINGGVQSLGNFYQQQQMMKFMGGGTGGYSPSFQSGGGAGSVPGGYMYDGITYNNPSAFLG